MLTRLMLSKHHQEKEVHLQKKNEMIELDKDTLGNKINKADNVLTKFKLIMSLENNSHIISVKTHD